MMPEEVTNDVEDILQEDNEVEFPEMEEEDE
jgi:hypothetical protein